MYLRKKKRSCRYHDVNDRSDALCALSDCAHAVSGEKTCSLGLMLTMSYIETTEEALQSVISKGPLSFYLPARGVTG